MIECSKIAKESGLPLLLLYLQRVQIQLSSAAGQQADQGQAQRLGGACRAGSSAATRSYASLHLRSFIAYA